MSDGIDIYGTWTDWPPARRDLLKWLPCATTDLLQEAYEFARFWHDLQVRPGGEPYTWHLLEVLEISVKVGQLRGPGELQAALLHDVVEDTSVTSDQLTDHFGDSVAELVQWLTKPEDFELGAAQIRAHYLERFASAPAAVRIIKLADRYSNVQRLDTHPSLIKQRSYYLETCRYFLPISVGIQGFEGLFSAWSRNFSYLDSGKG